MENGVQEDRQKWKIGSGIKECKKDGKVPREEDDDKEEVRKLPRII